MTSRPTFGFVHGAWHRRSSWSRLTSELDRRGFASVTMDLPSDDPDAGVDQYADAVVAALDDVDSPLILVGHSLGGLTIPVVASIRPVALLVYLCALLPQPGTSLVAQRATDTDMMTTRWQEEWLPQQIKHPDGTVSWPTELAADIFYHDCNDADIASGLAQLRPQSARPMAETTPLAAWPQIPAEYIACESDRVVNPGWSRRAAKERLGVDAHELVGGHSPFLADPGTLADCLVELATTHGLLPTEGRPTAHV